MVYVRCEDVKVGNDGESTLQRWLHETSEVYIKRAFLDGWLSSPFLRVKDNTGRETSILPASLTQKALRRLGCNDASDVEHVFIRCRASISRDKRTLEFYFVDDIFGLNEIRLTKNHFFHKVSESRSEVIFGSAKEALDDIDEEDPMDSVYSHIPIRMDDRTRFVDLRDAGCGFVQDVERQLGIDLETYYRSLTLWIDSMRGGALPFRLETYESILLPVPPTAKIMFTEFSFTNDDLISGIGIRPSTQFGDWKRDDEGYDYCMAYEGRPIVFDKTMKVTRKLVLAEDLKKDAFTRLLQESGWPIHNPAWFTKSFDRSFRSTRSMFTCDSRCKGRRVWTATVPKAMER